MTRATSLYIKRDGDEASFCRLPRTYLRAHLTLRFGCILLIFQILMMIRECAHHESWMQDPKLIMSVCCIMHIAYGDSLVSVACDCAKHRGNSLRMAQADWVQAQPLASDTLGCLNIGQAPDSVKPHKPPHTALCSTLSSRRAPFRSPETKTGGRSRLFRRSEVSRRSRRSA